MLRKDSKKQELVVVLHVWAQSSEYKKEKMTYTTGDRNKEDSMNEQKMAIIDGLKYRWNKEFDHRLVVF